MTDWRAGTPDDATALRDLERAANLVALAHVFPPAEFAFPDAAVLARWCATLADPGVRVDVIEQTGRLCAYVAYDAHTLRHLAVHPDDWGRGLAREGVARAVDGIAGAGSAVALLWCLEANGRALGLYAHLGWRPNGARRLATWPPHPVEVQLQHAVDGRNSRGLWRGGAG